MLQSVVAVLLVSLTCGQNPAVQVTLNDKGLQYGNNVAAGWIQDRLEVIALPDIDGSFRIGALGSVRYTLSGITITKCDFPQPSLQFDEDIQGLKASTSGLNVALTGGWQTHYGIIHESGSFNMVIFNMGVTSAVELGRDPDGHLSVTTDNCEAHVEDVEVQFHGGSSWIFQPFVDYYKGRIRGEIEENICPHVKQVIVNLESHLQAMNVSIDVNDVVTLGLPLTRLPLMDASSLNLGLKGEFYDTKSPSDPPFEAQPFTLAQQPDYMLSLGLSEFTLNSAAYGYQSAGALQVLITDSMLPPLCPIHLNTSSMGRYIPQLPKMFPGLLMDLQVYAREVPQFSFHPGAVTLDLQGAAKAFAIQPNGTQTPLFKLNVDSDFSGKVWIADGKLKGSMNLNNLTLTLDSSEVGTFDVDALQSVVRLGSKFAMSLVNDKLGKGVDLPRLKQAELVNTVLEVEEGFIAISSDAKLYLTDADFD